MSVLDEFSVYYGGGDDLDERVLQVGICEGEERDVLEDFDEWGKNYVVLVGWGEG